MVGEYVAFSHTHSYSCRACSRKRMDVARLGPRCDGYLVAAVLNARRSNAARSGSRGGGGGGRRRRRWGGLAIEKRRDLGHVTAPCRFPIRGVVLGRVRVEVGVLGPLMTGMHVSSPTMQMKVCSHGEVQQRYTYRWPKSLLEEVNRRTRTSRCVECIASWPRQCSQSIYCAFPHLPLGACEGLSRACAALPKLRWCCDLVICGRMFALR